MPDTDRIIRLAAIRYVEEQVQMHGEVLSSSLLKEGFPFEGNPIKLMGPQGIFKPASMDLPLTITTAPPSPRKAQPYDDQLGDNGTIRYRYRGTDPKHPDNAGLREAMRHSLPLIYFFGIVPGSYCPVCPVFVVGDDPQQLTFLVQVEEAQQLSLSIGEASDAAEHARRDYVTVLTKKRLHQASFRERVLQAYQRHCAICRLRHEELLDAAHIIPDHQGGLPAVTNGLALCKLHHAAFDRNFLGIRPDLIIDVRPGLLKEKDGPMLLHGLQGVHGSKIRVPRPGHQRPDPDLLERRYDSFRRAQ